MNPTPAFARPFAEYDMAKPTKSTKHLRRLEAQQRERLRRTEARERARAEALAIERGIDETLDLAAARGEMVEALPSGAKRMDDRDPVESLARCGRLTPEQAQIGKDVRDLYDRRVAGLGSQMEMLANTTGSCKDNAGAIFAGIQRGKALQKLGVIEIAVSMARDSCGRYDPNALTMLRAVCGEGKTLTSMGRGRAYERNAESLVRALNIAAPLMRPGSATGSD